MSTGEESGFSPAVSEHFPSGEEDESSQQQLLGRRRGQRITEYIADRQLRLKSYLRRRPIPFKRVREIDASCGTSSILVQIGADLEECLYAGSKELVTQFLSPEGLRISNVQDVVKKMRKITPRSELSQPEKESTKSSIPGFRRDDDYSPPIVKRKRLEKSKKKELQPSAPGDGAEKENWKAFRARRESLLSKIQETDSVCACRSFLLMICLSKDVAFYHGDPELVSLFFSMGFSRQTMDKNINVRPFDLDEMEYNLCSVPHCIVTRHTLSKWRLAAIEMYKFPWDFPMMLHVCPDEERQNWIAELDLDPSMDGKVCVCSLHFKDGSPTQRHPHPTELLRELKEEEDTELHFQGAGSSNDPPCDVLAHSKQELAMEPKRPFTQKFIKFSIKRDVIKSNKQQRKIFSPRRLIFKNQISKTLTTMKLSQRIVARCLNNALRSKIRCRRCKTDFAGNRNYYSHFMASHRNNGYNQSSKEDEKKSDNNVDASDEDSKLVIDEENFGAVEEESKTFESEPPVTVTKEEEKRCLRTLYPHQTTKTMNPKKKYVCAVCKSVCDLFGLFIHMKQIHQGILCQYCLKLFKKVSDLELHMKNVHRVRPRYFHSAKEFAFFAGTSYSLVCSACSKIVRFKDLERHPCSSKQKRVFDCPFCERNFVFQSQLELHLCNGWCQGMSWLKNPTSAETAKLYKVLTGIDLVKDYNNHQDKLQQKMILKEEDKIKKPKKLMFNVSDKQILAKVGHMAKPKVHEIILLEGLPSSGSIFCGRNSRGMNNPVKKEVKDSGYTFDLAARLKDAKLPVGKEIQDLEITRAGKNFILHSPQNGSENNSGCEEEELPAAAEEKEVRVPTLTIRTPSMRRPNMFTRTLNEKTEEEKPLPLILKVTPSVRPKKESKKDRRARIATEIYINMCRIKEAVDHFKEKCLFCQQTCFVSVDTVFLLSHLMIIHNPLEVENVLQEDPQHCVNRIKKHLKDVRARDSIFTYDVGEDFKFTGYRCCYCSEFTSSDYSDLFNHVGEVHKTKVLACHLCQNIFLNYGSYVSHVCFGPPSGGQNARAKFSCKVCRKQDLGTFLDFQFHLRKVHNLCEICLQSNETQETLYHHCQSHSQELMCMKCFLTYEDKLQFSKHLYYKHDDEHKVCRACHQKTWPHVYHFCIKQQEMVCEVCDVAFADFKQYRVHLRTHTGANPYLCAAKSCQKSYISRHLLWKHQIRRHPEMRSTAGKSLEEKRNKRQMVKFGASHVEHINLCVGILDDVLKLVIPAIPERKKHVIPERKSELKEEKPEVVSMASIDEVTYDPIDAAVRSIMGPEGSFNENKSPVKLSPVRPEPPPKPFLQLADTAFEPPQLIVRGPSGQSVHIHPHQIRRTISSPVNAAHMIRAQGGNIPIVRVGQVLPPSYIPPPQRGANIRLPSIPGRPPGPLRIHPGQGPPGYGPVMPQSRPDEIPRDDSATDDASEQEDCAAAQKQPVVSGIWNQDLMIISSGQDSKKDQASSKTIKTLNPNIGGWDVMLSESSDSEGEIPGPKGEKPKKAKVIERISDRTISLRDHDYCYASYVASQTPREDLTEMGKILSNVAIGSTTSTQFAMSVAAATSSGASAEKSSKKSKRKKEGKKKKKKKKRKKSKQLQQDNSSSSDSEADLDITTPGIGRKLQTPSAKVSRTSTGPRPKYHTPGASTGVTAVTARPCFSSSSEDDAKPRKHEEDSDSSLDSLNSSDLDTDFEADELLVNLKQIQNKSRRIKPSAKAVEAQESAKMEKAELPPKPTLKLKIKLPPKPTAPTVTVAHHPPPPPPPPAPPRARMINTSLAQKVPKGKVKPKAQAKKRKGKPAPLEPTLHSQSLSKKMRDSLALNQAASSSSSAASSSSSGSEDESKPTTAVRPTAATTHIKAGVVPFVPFSDDRLYCVCQCPHDDVSEMIGCDAPDCRIEWFHFECVGIMVPPEGKWYCPECSKRYKIHG